MSRSRRPGAGAVLLFCVSSGALAWLFFLYPLALALLRMLRPSTRVRRRAFEPDVTIIIPTHNEAAVIERRLCNLWESDYPPERMEVLVVDSGSSDGTTEIVEEVGGRSEGRAVRLVREPERRGKAAAINVALAAASHDLVILSDAPTLYDRDTLRRIVSNMADERVGAATGTFRPGHGRSPAQRSEGIFWGFKNRLRELEGGVDSTTYLQGELCCFRKSLLGTVDEDTLADDVNIALRIRSKGFRVVADPEARFTEEKPDTFQELSMRKSSAALGGIRESYRFRRMLFARRFGLFGAVIFPTRLLYSPLTPFLVAASALTGTGLALRLLKVPSTLLVALGAVAAVLVLGPLRGYVLRPALAFLFSQWVILKALASWLGGTYDVRWEQAKSVRGFATQGRRIPSADRADGDETHAPA